MELITTHIGADFDALASMLAARRLYPAARLFFPGSREASVRKMLAAHPLELCEVRQKDVEPGELRRVILCDSRQRGRLGVVAEWLDANPGIEVVAFDHHPDCADDLVVGGGRVDAGVGATATLLVEEFRRRALVPDRDEATALLLGLHEDTGSFTYATTSARDHAAAAWLVSAGGAGGDLDAVRRFASRQLDVERLELLHEMVRSLAVIERIRGHRIGFVTLDLGRHVEELAPLVSRCQELFDLAALFACFDEGERVTVIARGHIPGFDLGAFLAATVGGGGHATAAAASVRNSTAIEAAELIRDGLAAALPPAATVRDLMIAPVLTLPAGTSVADAKAQLNTWRVNAAPVAEVSRGSGEGSQESGQARHTTGGAGPSAPSDEQRGIEAMSILPVAGIVTRQILDGAVQHGLGERAVESVMTRDLEWISPAADAEDLTTRMLGQPPRLVLVGDSSRRRPLGIVTRMAVLRQLDARLAAETSSAQRRALGARAEQQRIGNLLRERVAPEVLGWLTAAMEVSAASGLPVYAVGGFVRDLLLGRATRDLDLVVEGDGLGFATRLAAALGGRVHTHPAFLTAVVVDPAGRHIDVATARSEFYRAPAALPQVQTSALRQDLYRRDFTVNTLAIRLGPAAGAGVDREPELLDYFGARRDLDARTLRVLHSLSLLDDPTRALRAVRLEQRLGFHIAGETERLIRVAIQEDAFASLSPARLGEEVRLLLEEPASALRSLERLDELHLLGVMHPGLTLSKETHERLAGALGAFDWYRLQGLTAPAIDAVALVIAALACALPDGKARQDLGTRLATGPAFAARMRDLPERLATAIALLAEPDVKAHQANQVLAPFSGEELLLLLAGADERGRMWLRRELTELRSFRLRIAGDELVAAGFEPGPLIGDALRATRAARLDGDLAASDELRFALALLRSWHDSTQAHQLVHGPPARAAGEAGRE